jgi:hypothetical protein
MTPQDHEEAAREVRVMLGRIPKGTTLSTLELAARLVDHPFSATERTPFCVGKAAKLLSRMAPHMGELATHDGEVINDPKGPTWRRWRWHGQSRDAELQERIRDQLSIDPNCYD